MEYLEKSMGWKEPDFDTVLQYLRTVLLRREHSLRVNFEVMIADLLRRRLPHLHFAEHDITASLASSFDAWHHLSLETAISKAQRH